jgi:hypothetical protein
LGRASDQLLGTNNIGDGPFYLLFHARPTACNGDILTEAQVKSYSALFAMFCEAYMVSRPAWTLGHRIQACHSGESAIAAAALMSDAG